ncbi:ABC transporter permease [Peptacetobacter hominis]|uniref:ABC transporter permease n=1 Tax=Peptacetobacter hominis TaxID=2743610 RepID=A0A544QX20_9FIRM|nr:ABC transporter permease subunit [Peptacetobacter hominis]TQQ85221.1 ABC transporter permease [Peptacetobacter hominis]
MVGPLIKREIKSNYKILIIFMAILTMYGSIITSMFDPRLGEGMNALAESMPEFFAAFGMQNPSTELIDFLVNYLYGFIFIMIPFIFTLIMCHRLVARYIDRGSMAYFLNTHYNRTQIILNQAFILVKSIGILILYATVMVIVCSEVMFGGKLDIEKFIVLNIGLLCLHLFLGSMCFMFACIFNEIKYSIGIGAGLGLLFILIQMMSQVSEDADFLKYFTPLTLFNPDGIIAYETESLMYIVLLAVISIVFISVGTVVFKKRDLPL